MGKNNTDVLLLWAKTSRDEPQTYHPVLYHMLDVSNITLFLWNNVIHPDIKDKIGRQLNLSENVLPYFIAWLSGLHDIGKVTPVFQKKSIIHQQRLHEHGYIFPLGLNGLHGTLSSVIILNYLVQKDINPITAKNIAQLSGGHHGVFPSTYNMEHTGRCLGDQKWENIRTEIIESLWELLTQESFPSFDEQVEELTNSFILPVISGLISISDWIGSNIDYFPYNDSPDQRKYSEISCKNAHDVLKKLGYLPIINSQFLKNTFEELFPFSPNVLQEKVVEMVSEQKEPYLMAIEAKMGQGKTEAALYAINHAVSNNISRGFYIALPTQATSNAMYDRVRTDYLQKKNYDNHQSLQLVHGNALMDEVFKESLKIKGIEDGSSDNYSAQSWFTARKRPLLAYMGVGTIDQVLLSVLQTRHWFVRLFGLARKVVVFDEVHAYDTYMSTILERLISWLSEMDSTVILLSATLPREKLNRFIESYAGKSIIPVYPCYPRVTICDKQGKVVSDTLKENENNKAVKIRFVYPEIDQIYNEFINSRGCTAVICNTVNRAQDIYQYLKYLNIPECELILFHARMPFIWRNKREKEVIKLFGKPDKSQRPEKAILIATQVVEQSLDLDFDCIYSDMAPIDLILQRMGRLWRHPRPLIARGCRTPNFNIFIDNSDENEVPQQITSSRVYDPYILMKSYLALISLPDENERKIINIPEDIDHLVQDVYSEKMSLEVPIRWENTLNDLGNQFHIMSQNNENTALNILVNMPQNLEDLLESFNTELSEDENPEMAKRIRAATRLGDLSITVVCLREEDNKLYPVHSERTLDLEIEPNMEVTKELLESSCSISHQGIFYLLLENLPPESWKHNVNLKYTRVMIFRNGHLNIGNYNLELNTDIGISIRKE